MRHSLATASPLIVSYFLSGCLPVLADIAINVKAMRRIGEEPAVRCAPAP